jgi:hypothetical protein
MAKVFISYRRTDSATFSGRIYDRLAAKFGRKEIFKDVDDIPPGVNFADYIQTALRQCSVALAVIGPRWLGASTADGARRLDDTGDFVRLEIETALGLGLIVIPVLVEDARMPSAAELPEALRPLALINAVGVRNDPDFSRDMERLIAAVDRAKSQRRPSFVRSKPAAVRPEPAPSQPVVQDFGTPAPLASAAPVAPLATGPIIPASPPPTGRTVAPAPPRAAGAVRSAPSRSARYVGVAALLVVVVALGALLATKLPHGSGQGNGPGGARTAIGTTAVPLALPYGPTSPGPGCDKGTANWHEFNETTGGGGIAVASFTCLHNPERTELKATCSKGVNCSNIEALPTPPAEALVWNISSGVALPDSTTTAVDIRNLSASTPQSTAEFNVTWLHAPNGGTEEYTFTIRADGSYAIDRMSSSSGVTHVLSRPAGTINMRSSTALALSANGTAVKYKVNGSLVATVPEPGAFHPNTIQLRVTLNENQAYSQEVLASADFSNFSITQP